MAQSDIPIVRLHSDAHAIIGRPLFQPWMSKEAREIVDTIVQIFIERGRRIGNDCPILCEFAAGYQAVGYEDAVASFNKSEIITKLKSVLGRYKDKNAKEALEAAWLVPLFNGDWHKDVTRYTGGSRMSHSVSQTESYDWLMSKFILSDFSRFDLDVYAKLVSEYTLDEIQEVCNTLYNPEQHSIRYLAKCMENQKQSRNATNEKIEVLARDSRVEIEQLFRAQGLVGKIKPLDSREWLKNLEINCRILDENGDT